jgi:hypothetical protein
MTNEQTNAIRKRAWHYIEPSVAATAGMTIFEMQRFISYTFMPSDEQLLALARRMSLL